MSKLSTLLNKVDDNFQQYSKTKEIKLLLSNIEQFENISKDERLQALKTTNSIELANCNDVLYLMAETYIAYAFANQSNLLDKEADKTIVKALTCYKEIKKYISVLPPSFLSNALLLQNTKAIFFEAKTKFQQAQIRLHYTLNKMKNSSNTDQISITLDLITQKFNDFKALLGNYKSEVYQQMTDINQLYWVKTVTDELSKVEQAKQSLQGRFQNNATRLLFVAHESLPTLSDQTKETNPKKKIRTSNPATESMENPSKQEVDTSKPNENNSLEEASNLEVLSFFATKEFDKNQPSQEPKFPFKNPEFK